MLVFAQLIMGIYKVFASRSFAPLVHYFIYLFLPHVFSMFNAKSNHITMIFVIFIYAFLLQLSSF